MNASTTLSDLLHHLDAQMAAAEHELVAATGGQNVCRLAKAGQTTGGVKYHEGRLVALQAVRRLLQSAGAASPFTELYQLRAQWRGNLQTQQQRERPSLPWLAYSQGGADALEQLLGPESEGNDG